MKTPNDVLAERLAQVRNLRGYSQHELAEVLAEIGEPMPRSTIARTEAGQREVPLDQALALAAALDVAPTSLVLPLGATEQLRIAGTIVVTAREARQWFRGQAPLPRHDPRRFSDVVAEEDRRAVDDPGLRFLAECIGDLVYASVTEQDDDVADLIEEISDELARMRARLERKR